MTSRGRRTRTHDRRCRSGCWKCRDRRVKCGEERPSCRHCVRLGLDCCYEVRLVWKKVEGVADFQSRSPDQGPSRGHDFQSWSGTDAPTHIEDWMFLNTTLDDFRGRADSPSSDEDIEICLESPVTPCLTDPLTGTPTTPPAASTSPVGGAVLPQPWPERTPDIDDLITGNFLLDYDSFEDGCDSDLLDSVSRKSIPLSLPFRSLSSTDLYLLDYFQNVMTPHCTLSPTYNPYLDIIVRMAVTCDDGPLLPMILASAANEISSLGKHNLTQQVWRYRARALSLLREQLVDCETTTVWKGKWEPVFATVLMLCFFEVAYRCEESWVTHTRCARRLLSLPFVSCDMSQEQADLCKFLSTYFAFHNALARTVWDSGPFFTSDYWPFRDRSKDKVIDQLFGCSPELLEIIDTISSLGEEMDQASQTYRDDPLKLAQVQTPLYRRRDILEKRLFALNQISYTESASPETTSNSFPIPASSFTPSHEIPIIAEAKRLAALIYLYHRLDSALPQQPIIVRLTARILSLIPRVSLRTNTILWPLFIVGTMGIQSGREEDRKIVLGRLTALQRTRELGNVQRAKAVVEAIWRERDLKRGVKGLSWGTIIAGRGGKLSLS